jgi:hypothetical protein
MIAPGARDPMPAFLYVYVADADQSYRRAIAAGRKLSRNRPIRHTVTDELWSATRAGTYFRSHIDSKSPRMPKTDHDHSSRSRRRHG